MQPKIILLVDYLSFLRQNLNKCSSLNLDKIKSILNKNGYQVTIKNFQEIIQASARPKNCLVWYTGSDFPSYKNYIEDVLLYLKKDNDLIPPFDLFRAHENKGYQVLLRKKLKLPELKEYYFGTLEELDSLADTIEYPIVLKFTMGSGSQNVRLVKNRSHLRRTFKRLARTASFPKNIIKRYVKRYIRSTKYDFENSLESLYYKNFILQQYIPGLFNDWKVLIFFDKYYVLEREVRKNDFRASGSGKFFYRDFNLDMLDFCADIFKKFNTPWLSLDICRDQAGYHLLEFQGIHFGPIGLLNAPYYYVKSSNNQWKKIEKKSDLSEEYALSVVNFQNSSSISAHNI